MFCNMIAKIKLAKNVVRRAGEPIVTGQVDGKSSSPKITAMSPENNRHVA